MTLTTGLTRGGRFEKYVDQVGHDVLGLGLGSLGQFACVSLFQSGDRFVHCGVGIVKEGIESFLGYLDLHVRKVEHELLLLILERVGPLLPLGSKISAGHDFRLADYFALIVTNLEEREDLLGDVFSLAFSLSLPSSFLRVLFLKNIGPFLEFLFPCLQFV